MDDYNVLASDKTKAAVCGLFCPSCTIFIATHEDPERLKALATRMGLSPQQLECDGCRSDRLNIFCKTKCKMKKCAEEKGYDFCSECGDYPCEELKAFQVAMPHRIELFEWLQRIHEAGWESWYSEMIREFSCECGALNSAYDISCRNCGLTPGCDYVGRHKEEIAQHMGKLGR